MGVLDPTGAPLPRRKDKIGSTNPYRFMKLGNENEFIEIIDGKISIVADDVEINGYTPGTGTGDDEVEISEETPTEESIELWVDLNDNTLPLPVEVVTDPDYVHTDNNFTDALKEKLESIENNAQVNRIESISKNGAIIPIIDKRVNIEIPTKLSELNNDTNFITDSNYVHTDNNFTDALKEKLNNIENNAQVNKIESIQLNGVTQNITNKTVNIQLDIPTKTSDLVNDSNFVSDSNYVHTDNNFTDTLLSKLNNIESNAQVNKIEIIAVNNKNLSVEDKRVNIDIPTKLSDLENDANFVQDVDYVHTDNNFTDALLSKLNNIEASAQANKIEKIKLNGVLQNIVDKTVDLTVEIPTKLSELQNDANFVQDANYVHTDNNFTDELKTQITQNTSDVTTLKSDVTELSNNIDNLSNNKLDKNFTEKILTDMSISQQNNSNVVNLIEKKINPSTKQAYTETNALPLASATSAGLMTKESYSQISKNTSDIESLKGMGGKYIGIGFDTYADLEAYEIPDTVNVNDFTFVRDDETHDGATTQYIVALKDGVKKFDFAYIINEDTYGNFTNETAGLIKGKNEDGYVFAESDGTGSVVGWDTLKSDVNNAKTKLSGIESGAEVNKIEVIQKNGSALAISNKTVNITVPTKTSDLTNNSNFISDSNYVHTDNNFTDTLLNKLNGISAGAQVNKIESIKLNGVNQTISSKSVNLVIDIPTKTSDLINDSNFVVDANYTHTDNNFTDALLTKLNGIATGAQANKIETIAVNDTNQTITNKRVNITVPTAVSDLENDTGFITSSGSITGNAATATTATKANQLTTARTINGTAFNGTANITTANWGTARNISIASSDGSGVGAATSINGSTNYTLKLPSTIKATLNGNATNSNYLKQNSTYDNGTGTLSYYSKEMAKGTTVGQFVGPNAGWYHDIHLELSVNNYSADIVVPVNNTEGLSWRQNRNGTNYGWFRILDSGNYTSYTVKKDGTGATGTWGISISGNAATATKATNATNATNASNADTADIATKANQLNTARTINGTSFNGTANIVTSYWGTARNITIQDNSAAHSGPATSVNGSANVNLKLPATITASLSGNASSATKLQTARKINGVAFDGTKDITIPVAKGTVGYINTSLTASLPDNL